LAKLRKRFCFCCACSFINSRYVGTCAEPDPVSPLVYKRGYIDKTAAVDTSWGCWMFCFVALRDSESGSAQVPE